MTDTDKWPLPRLLSTAARMVEHAWNDRLTTLGLTHAGVIALEVLDAEGPMVQARLAAKIRVQTATMGKTLSRLEAHGHITRAPNPSDLRSNRVELSGPGRTALQQAREIERNLTSGADLGTGELRDRLVTIIRRLGAVRWEGQHPKTPPKDPDHGSAQSTHTPPQP